MTIANGDNRTEIPTGRTAIAERGRPAQIAARIGRRSLQGELRPGDLLPNELTLLAQLQVSRTTLREALTMLSSRGFIKARQKVGTRICAPENWNTLDPMVMSWQGTDEKGLAQEMFEIRLAIEPMAAQLAAERATAHDLDLIRAALAAMSEDYRNAQKAIEADITFHLCIIHAAHNRFLMPVASVIRQALSISIPRTFETFGGLSHAFALHADIAVHIEARRPEEAAAASRRLLEDTYRQSPPAAKG